MSERESAVGIHAENASIAGEGGGPKPATGWTGRVRFNDHRTSEEHVGCQGEE